MRTHYTKHPRTSKKYVIELSKIFSTRSTKRKKFLALVEIKVKIDVRKPLPFNVKTACSKGNKPIKFYKVMEILSQNNTFENTQTTSFLNKLDALIASGYADADDYTHTAGENARPTPISADFAENIEFNKTLLLDFIEALLDATPPEHKNPVAAALDALRYANKYRFLSNTELFLEAFVAGLAKLDVPKNIIKLTTPILCAVLPNTTPDSVERKLNERYIEDSSFDLQFFENPDYKSDYDNFAGKFIDNSWLAELNKANWLKFEPCEVSEMPPAAETKISQATGTDGDLPTQKLASIIDNAEADATATANNEIYNYKKGMTPERNLKMIISQQTNNNNAENDTNVATDATNSASNIKTPPATKQVKNQSNAGTAMPKYNVKKDFSDYEKTDDYYSFIANKLNEVGIIYDALDLSGSDIVKCKTTDKAHRKNGRYICHLKEIITPKGRNLFFGYLGYQNHVTSEWLECKFTNLSQAEYNNNNDTEFKKLVKKALEANEIKRQKAAEKLKQEREFASKLATKIYNESDFYTQHYSLENPHPYLKKKNLYTIIDRVKIIKAEVASKLVGDAYGKTNYKLFAGSELKGDLLVIPMYNISGEFTSLQLIDINGTKYFLKGGAKSFFEITGNAPTFNNVAVAEGLATGASIKLALKDYKVFISFDAGNLSNTVGELVKANSNAKITIFADNDKESHTGEIHAKKAIEAHGGKYIMPPPDYNDFNDFFAAEFANNNGNINAVISIMQNYINQALQNKNVKKYRFIQKETKRVMSVDRAKTKNENEVGKIKATTQNVIEALQNREYCGFEFILEERSQNIEVIDYVEYSKDADGNEEMYFNEDGKQPRPLTELDYLEIKSRIEYHPKNNPTGFEEISINKILRGAVEFVARKKSYNKIQNFIDNLPKLKGEALEKAIYKLENLFIYYANADIERFPSEYYKAVARCFMTEIIARCLTKTGCKADYMPILQGKQGTKKSQFCLSLINDPSLIADVDFDNNTDDIIRKISGKVIGVIDEMNGFGKKQASFVKKFITFTHDTYIPKYKEFEKVITRSVVFIGTTNEEQFLNDVTGERRYYPIPIKDGAETRYLELKRDILEIYAAALHLYNEDKAIGIEITADGKEVEHNGVLFHNLESWNKQATKEFKLENPYITNIERWLNTTYKHNEYIKSPDYFVAGKKPLEFEYLLTVDVAMFALDITKDKYNIHTHGKNIKAALIELGYKNITKRINGKPCKVLVNTNTNLNNYNAGNNNNNDADDNIPF